MYRSILVPLDGSEFGEHALPVAVGIARRAGAEVQAVHVHVPVVVTPLTQTSNAPYNFERWEAEARDEAKKYMDGMSDRLSSAVGTAASAVVLEGTVVPTLEDYLRRSEADLVVMTTHGRGPLSRAWLGSVADGLLRQSTVPVLLIRPEAEQVPPIDRDREIQHVLVPLDGSPIGEGVIEHAVRLGRLYGARYTLIRVVSPQIPVGYPPVPHGALLESAAGAEPEEVAREYVDGVAERMRSDGFEVDSMIVRHRQPAVAILAAAEQDVDMIAMATHGRGGFSRLVLGSVADKVIRATNVPMLVCRPEMPD